MTRRLFFFRVVLTGVIISAWLQSQAAAKPDLYMGDTVIYTGAGSHNMPNVLLLIDNSASTLDTASGVAYDNTHNYYNECVAQHGAADCYATFGIYSYNAGQNDWVGPVVTPPSPNTGGVLNTSAAFGSISNLVCQPSGSVANALMGIVGKSETGGTYQGAATDSAPNLKKKKGSPDTVECDTAGQGQAYALGNFLNYTLVPPPPVLVTGSDEKAYRLIKSHTSKCPSVEGPDNVPITGSDWETYWQVYSGPVTTTPAVWEQCKAYNLGTGTQQKLIYDAVNTVVSGARFAVKFGAMIYGHNNQGGQVVNAVKNLSENADFTTFMNKLPGGAPGAAVLSSNTARPQAEALYDSYEYFYGKSGPHFESGSFPSVFSSSYCEKLTVILITNGLPNGEQANGLASVVGDYDGDGMDSVPYGQGTHYLDDVAKKMHVVGVPALDSYNEPVVQRITTNVILAFQADDPLLKHAAENGEGLYFVVNNANELTEKLGQIVNNIMLEADSSFVAPVVPVSPQSKVYSGSRIYMGFFKPMSEQHWYGNIKKYAISSDGTGTILDVNNAYANYTDLNADFKDDRDDEVMEDVQNGGFRESAQSYWSSTADGGTVDAGGVGGVLLARTYSIGCPTCDATGSTRSLYTVTGNKADLTDSSNAFSTLNSAITSTLLGLPGDVITSGTTTDVKQLINFVQGFDVYDKDADDDATEKRPWIFGDVLHSKPFILSYATYTFTGANEVDCTKNKTMIYVGTNDGMLHAIKDCDGSEAWAFIPPSVLPYLQYLTGPSHAYFLDSTLYAYVYDHNKNGTINSGDDRVILIMGLGRGAGVDTAPTTGFYYALDVSDPAAPKFLWGRSNTTRWRANSSGTIDKITSGALGALGEAWSEPKIVKMKIGSTDKIMMFFGGGYDNCYEDARYGSTQTFSGVCVGNLPTNDGGLDGSDNPKSSAGSTSFGGLTNERGNALYALEIAYLDANGFPQFTNSGLLQKAWTGFDYPLVAEPTALSMANSGYADRFYVSDTGGNLYRVDASATDTGSWTVRKIFSANPGADSSQGRKIFYKPSAAIESNKTVRLYFGTGDREHPLNRAVVDRVYGIVDKGQDSAKTEADLIDVTEDEIQGASTFEEAAAIKNQLALSSSATSSVYGWYIRLDGQDRGGLSVTWPGEKVLAPATLFNKVVYLTTYSPNTAVVTDPCQIGNLGMGRLYAVDYLTGNAVFNFDKSNDSGYASKQGNTFAVPSGKSYVLEREDRSLTEGPGIPSGVVVDGPIGFGGNGGGIFTFETTPGGQVLPLYWRQR